MRTFVSFLLVAWLAYGSPSWAADDGATTDPFSAGTAAFAQEDYLLALSHFQNARAAGLDGPAIHYNIAVCHYKLGDYRAAESAFALIADRYPDMRGLAQYNLGLVALQQGDQSKAEMFFRQSLTNSDDRTVQYLARRQLGFVSPPPKEWLTLVDARVGHDNNVLLLAEEIALPDGESAESSFTEFWALISGPLSSNGGFRFDGSVFGVRYSDASIFDQTALRIGTAYVWRWGAWQAEAGPHLSYSTLDGDSFEQRFGFGTRFRRQLGPQSSLGLRFIHEAVEDGEERFAAFEGDRDWLELRVDRRLSSGQLSAAYSLEFNDRAGAHVSPTRNRLSLRYRLPFRDHWLADMQVSWRDSRYGDLTEPRDEDLGELSVALTRALPQGWQLGGEVALANNDSNVETVAYDRNRFSLGLNKQF